VTLADIAAEPWLLPTPKMRVRRALDELVAGAGLAALNARIESDTITAGHFRLLEGTRMLALCTEWWLPTLRRLGLEPLPLPPDEIGPARAVALMRRLDGYVSPLAARLRELLTERVGRRAD
jgi:DNA-binding transcriptional LysR family regulator